MTYQLLTEAGFPNHGNPVATLLDGLSGTAAPDAHAAPKPKDEKGASGG